MSTIYSAGNFYMGIDKEKYCQFDIHLGRLRIEYSCPNIQVDGQSKARGDRQED